MGNSLRTFKGRHWSFRIPIPSFCTWLREMASFKWKRQGAHKERQGFSSIANQEIPEGDEAEEPFYTIIAHKASRRAPGISGTSDTLGISDDECYANVLPASKDCPPTLRQNETEYAQIILPSFNRGNPTPQDSEYELVLPI